MLSILERFLATLDCVDVSFISDETLDQLPLSSRVGKVRVGGIDLNSPRMRAALSAVLALGPSPMGFGVTQFRAKVLSMIGQSDADYTPRNAAYDLKKLRGKQSIAKASVPHNVTLPRSRPPPSTDTTSASARTSNPSLSNSAWPVEDQQRR